MAILASLLYPTHTISLLEIVRFVLGTVGITDASQVAIRSYQDLKWLKNIKLNGPRQYSAVTYFRLHVTTVVVQLFLMGNTVVAMTVPTPHHKIWGAIGNGFIILTILLLMVMSFETDRRKKHLYRMMDRKTHDIRSVKSSSTPASSETISE